MTEFLMIEGFEVGVVFDVAADEEEGEGAEGVADGDGGGLIGPGAWGGGGADEEVVDVISGDLEGVGETDEGGEGSCGGPACGAVEAAVNEEGADGREEHAGEDVASVDDEHSLNEEAIGFHEGVGGEDVLKGFSTG